MRSLVVGAGSIGRRHLANLRALGAGPVSAWDADPAARAAVQAEPGVTVPGSLDAALAAGPELVLVCTPSHLHLDVAHQAVDAGAHVFVEKPVAITVDGVDGLAAHARARGRRVFVGCNMRFHPGPAALKRVVESGVVGAPRQLYARFSHLLSQWRPGTDYRRTYSAQRAQGGGVALEAVHEIDYLRWIAGEIVAVAGWVGRLGDLELEVEDTAVLALRFAAGAIGHVSLDYLSPVKLRGCEVVGTEGAVRWTSEGKSPEAFRVERIDRSGARHAVADSAGWDANAMYVDELRALQRAVAGEPTALLELDGARRVLELALAARTAGEAGSGGWRAIPAGAEAPALTRAGR